MRLAASGIPRTAARPRRRRGSARRCPERHSRFGWADLLIDGILVPVHQGRAVRYRPPRWAEHGREGSIEVPADCPLLVIEGDGAGRREVADLIGNDWLMR